MKKQILVVTNEAELYQTLQEHLNDDISKVYGVSSISESLHCLLTREYCLVILDIQSALREQVPITLGPSAIISPQYRQVLVDGKSLKLTRKEFDIIYYMAQHPYQVFSRRQLFEQVWNMDAALGGEDTVTTHIKTLRKKLTAMGLELIETIRGLGYRYTPPAAE